MVYRAILAKWREQEDSTLRRSYEGEFTGDRLKYLNSQHYSIYYWPNPPSFYDSTRQVDGSQIDQFRYVFLDMDLKDGVYESKDAFLETLGSKGLLPTIVTDSGNGIHAYFEVSDLDAMSYLRLQRRLCRFYRTDPAVSQICQLMRVPGYFNPKVKGAPILCEILFESDSIYTCEALDKAFPGITQEDEEHCRRHYELTYNPDAAIAKVDERLPVKFDKLVKDNAEVRDIWSGKVDDRSKGDFRLAHIMWAAGFSKKEAMSVLVNCSKALTRAPVHRIGYAEGIVSKIWTDAEVKVSSSPTVRDILCRGEDTIVGTRFPCHRLIDDTVHGFRLGQVIGIIGGSGVGKTTLTLNAFLWFAENNPDYHHFFFSLEQPPGEIASRIKTICQGNEALFDKIHIVYNYDDGEFKHLSLDLIEEHLLQFQKDTGEKVGATVIDHIGVLAKSDRNGENDGLIGVCRRMKAVAVNVNTMLIMLSQAPREKAGIGDQELNKNAAYGTVFFEAFVDYCLCLWQPLKRFYSDGAPTIMAIKFAKIRHKKQGLDRIKEDICYQLFFDPNTEKLRELTQTEEQSVPFWVGQVANKRKEEAKKTSVVEYESRRVSGGESNNNSDSTGTEAAS